MDTEDFRRIALSMDGAIESAHMGNPDFRAGTPKPRIFATLASAGQGYGNLKLTPELQAEIVAEWPEWFLPIAGGWGRMGMTHVRLADVPEDVLREALRAAWKIAVAPKKPARKKK